MTGRDIPKVPFAYGGIELQAGILRAKELMGGVDLVMVIYVFPWICAVNTLKEMEHFKTIAFLRGSDVFLGCNPHSGYRKYFEEGLWEHYSQIVIDAINQSDRVYSVSEMQKNFSEDLGIRVDGIYPTPPFEDEHILSHSRKELKLLFRDKTLIQPDINTPWILYLGRFHPEKQPELVIKAFLKVHEDAELIMAGHGIEQQRLEHMKKEYALDNVHICFIPPKHVPLACAASEIMVHPTTPRAFLDARPSSCTNASYYGCSIIFPYSKNMIHTGLAESVSEDNTKLLTINANNGDEKVIDEMAEKIKLLIEDAELRNNIGEKNREHAKKFSRRSIFPKLDKEMKMLCEQERGHHILS
jgi:glycosyltransferase involved in cell wall biosynthesis